MDKERLPKSGEIYKHFKNKLYQIITIATHSETGEQMVVYQALYGSFKSYVRPLSMFLSKVDIIKYPDVKQVYRFEKINVDALDNQENNQGVNQYNTYKSLVTDNQEKGTQELDMLDKDDQTTFNKEQLNFDSYGNGHINSEEIKEPRKENSYDKEATLMEFSDSSIDDSQKVNEVLLEFLDASSYEEKLAILNNKKKYIDDTILNHMAVSLDVTVEEGELEDRMKGFAFCLQTLARFENRRLR